MSYGDGFPKTGWGSWAQFRERVAEAVAADTGQMGINCEHVPAPRACGPCLELKREWRRRNGLSDDGRSPISNMEAGRKLAGL